MEWKRRRAEEIKTQQEEQATLEQLQQAEAETEAARKLAAARAEEAERRIAAGRESTAEAVRATESAEKWAKTSRQRERRRAEVYAINAVMRCVNGIRVAFALAGMGPFAGQERRVIDSCLLRQVTLWVVVNVLPHPRLNIRERNASLDGDHNFCPRV